MKIDWETIREIAIERAETLRGQTLDRQQYKNYFNGVCKQYMKETKRQRVPRNSDLLTKMLINRDVIKTELQKTYGGRYRSVTYKFQER
tara:strand:+ start:5172 stop:5438 length:267 start_codon:yes stop_codon:yes gene_type:complete